MRIDEWTGVESPRSEMTDLEHQAIFLRYYQAVEAYWSAPEGVGSVFKRCLLSAITDGLTPPRTSRLGPRTCDAIQRVADDHPEAGVDLIANAFDVFALEHSGVEIPAVDLGDTARTTSVRKGDVTRRKRVRVP